MPSNQTVQGDDGKSNSKKPKMTDRERKEADKKIRAFIASQNIPLSTINSKEFKSFIKALNPEYAEKMMPFDKPLDHETGDPEW